MDSKQLVRKPGSLPLTIFLYEFILAQENQLQNCLNVNKLEIILILKLKYDLVLFYKSDRMV